MAAAVAKGWPKAMIEEAAVTTPSVHSLDPQSLYDNRLVRKVEESGLLRELYRD